jgi:acyl carrier protein
MEKRVMVERLQDYISSHFMGSRRRRVLEDEPLLESGILDSIGVLDLLGYLENEFGIVVQDDDLVPENLQSVNRIAEFVQAKLSS